MNPPFPNADADATRPPTPTPQALWDGDPAVRDWTDSQWDAVLSDPSAAAQWHHLGQMAEALQAADRGQRIAPIFASDALAFARGVVSAARQPQHAPQAAAPLAPELPEVTVAPVTAPQPLQRPVRPALGGAAGVPANDPVFGWRLVAGFSALVAVAAVGWSNWSAPHVNPHPALRVQAPAEPAPEAVRVATPQGVVERDARLEALMRTHRQAGGGAGLQAPAGFLRAATHDAPER